MNLGKMKMRPVLKEMILHKCKVDMLSSFSLSVSRLYYSVVSDPQCR